MASPVMFTVDELVEFNQKYCLITDITKNKHGWNIFTVQDIVSEEKFSAHKSQLKKVENIWLDDFQEPMTMEVDEQKENIPAPKRFASLTPEDVDKIADARNCNSTKTQTKWAIKIMRGE